MPNNAISNSGPGPHVKTKMKNGQVSEQAEKLLKKTYYDDKVTFGRDGLYEYLKRKHPDDHPSTREIQNWLKKQELHQIYQFSKKAGTTDHFIPIKPWHEVSVDLMDYSGGDKSRAGPKYVLVVLDNFSRFIYTEIMNNKKSWQSADALRKILRHIRSDHGKTPKYLLSDAGSEFLNNNKNEKNKKQSFLELLKEFKITKRQTLGGTPWANGLVERANGKIKMILAKTKSINGKSWMANLKHATDTYNEQYNTSTKFAPIEAVDLPRMAWKELIFNVKQSHKPTPPEKKRYPEHDIQEFEVGDQVRLRIAKGGLSKGSTPSWSTKVYTIENVIKKNGAMARKYQIKGKPKINKYSRGDMQLVTSVDPVSDKVIEKHLEELERTETLEAPSFNTRSKKQRPPPPPSRSPSDEDAIISKKKKKPLKSSGGDVYIIEEILDDRTSRKKKEYKIKYEGFPAEWQTLVNMKKDIDEQLLKLLLDNYKLKKKLSEKPKGT